MRPGHCLSGTLHKTLNPSEANEMYVGKIMPPTTE